MTREFTITQEMVDRFVELTGDRNSMHVSHDFARRMRYRRRVVHGMLPFSFLMLAKMDLRQKDVDLASSETRFLKPVFAGDQIRLTCEFVEAGDGVAYEAKWINVNNAELLIRSKGQFRKFQAPTTAAPAVRSESFLVGDVKENVATISELENRSESISFAIMPNSAQRYCQSIFHTECERADNNLLATTMLSTLVGMRLPGRYASFTDFRVDFHQLIGDGMLCRLNASVRKVTPETEAIALEVSIDSNSGQCASGSVGSLVNPPPRATVTSRELQQHWLDLGIRGKVAIVTGSSRGIGAATAKLLALHGAKLVVNYIRGKADAEEVVDDIRSAGGEAIAVQCDVTDAAQVKKMVQSAVEHFQTVHLLVNNAVKDFQPHGVMELSWEDYLGEMEVAVKGMHLCCREVIPLMKNQREGKIISLSTIAVDNPVKGQSKYITAKSAVVGYMRSLAKELAGDNISANVVSPNMTETDLIAVLPTAMIKRIGQFRPSGKNLHPAQVAQSIVFLASQWSNAMTGQKLVLNLGEPPFT